MDFYEGVFSKHQVQTYSDRYIGTQYIQHNPYVADGKAPFVNYFTQYFKEHPDAKNTIKRVVAEGDLVVLHVHSTQNAQDRGEAVVDIFRVEQGKIVEHWDVIQSIAAESANRNTMFSIHRTVWNNNKKASDYTGFFCRPTQALVRLACKKLFFNIRWNLTFIAFDINCNKGKYTFSHTYRWT